MNTDPADMQPKEGESPAAFIERVLNFLTEPDRRRMGVGMADNVRRAVARLNEEAEDTGLLSKYLEGAATMPVEAMTDTDSLRAAMETADDLAERLQTRLRDLDYWWTDD